MKIAINYIAIGRYDVFFKKFYKSCEKYFLPDCEKEYFVFTDSKNKNIFNHNNVNVIFQEDMGWPDNTMQRFKLFNSIRNKTEKFAYTFFFNANIQFVKEINKEILPESGLIFVQQAGMAGKDRKLYPYDENPKSNAYIPPNEGEVYVAGGFNGGETLAYLKMCEELQRRTDEDTKNNVIALFHDESQINRYILDINKSDYVVWDCGFLYPDIYYIKGITMKVKLVSKELYISVLKIKGEKSILNTLSRYMYIFYRLITSSVKRKIFK